MNALVSKSLVTLQFQSKLFFCSVNCHIHLVDLETQLNECLGKPCETLVGFMLLLEWVKLNS